MEEKCWNPEAFALSRLAREQSLSLRDLPCHLPPAPGPLRPTSRGDPPASVQPSSPGVHAILLLPACISAPNSPAAARSIRKPQLCCWGILLPFSLSCSTKDALKSESEGKGAACGKLVNLIFRPIYGGDVTVLGVLSCKCSFPFP